MCVSSNASNPESKSTTAGVPVVGTVPAPMKVAAIVAILEGVVAIAGGVYFAITQAQMGTDETLVESDTPAFAFVGVGTAIFVLLVFGPMLAGAVGILRGHTWGRSLIVFLNVLLLGISVYMFSGGATTLGVITLFAGLLALGCALHPASTSWATASFDERRARQL